jgi:hypothetical protein
MSAVLTLRLRRMGWTLRVQERRSRREAKRGLMEQVQKRFGVGDAANDPSARPSTGCQWLPSTKCQGKPEASAPASKQFWLVVSILLLRIDLHICSSSIVTVTESIGDVIFRASIASPILEPER